MTATGTTGGTSLSPPTNLTATSAANSITLNWTASPGAHHYQIERRTAGNPAFQVIGTSTGTSYTDATVTSGAAYVYRVRAADAQNNLSGSSNARLGVAIAFTDPTLLSGITLVKAAHVTELRQAVNGVRVLSGLSQSSWTDATLLALQVKAIHVEELRTALTPALQALSLTVPGFTDAQLFGVLIKKLHIEELRAGVNASGAGDSGGGSSPIPIDGLASASYSQATNRINSAGWEYDAAGNQTRAQRTDGSWQRYIYDAAGRLVKVQNDSFVTQIIHTYGASNHRLIEQVGNESSNQRTYYAWAGDSVIAEYEETAAAPTTPRWVKSYVYLGGRLLATLAPIGASERVEYNHPDRLGTRLVTNNQDTTSFEQAALPFGKALDAESSGTTKRRFTSYERSSVSGLDYAVNRHYDPLQGRFTQVDPIGMAAVSLGNPQTLNLYAYCTNDPINHTDPSGLGFFSFLGKLFGAIGKVFHFVAKVLAVVAAVAAVVFLAWSMPGVALAFAIMSGILFASAYGPPIVGKILIAVGTAARSATVAGTPPINPTAGGGIGPISSFLAQNPELPVRRIGLGDLLRLLMLPDALAAARTALQRERCRSLFGAGVNPVELLDTLARGNTTRGSISLGNLGTPQGGNVTAAQTTGVLGVRTVVRIGHVGPEFIRQSAFIGANIVINNNRASPFLAGYRRRFGASDSVNRAVTVIHELGHAATITYGPGASMIVDDQNNAGQSRANSQRVYNDCFR